MCVNFHSRYAIGGLSADRVRVLLHPMPDAEFQTRMSSDDTTADDTSSSTDSTDDEMCPADKPVAPKCPPTISELMKDYDGSDDVVLWEARDGTLGDWKEGQIVYTFNQPHSVS